MNWQEQVIKKIKNMNKMCWQHKHNRTWISLTENYCLNNNLKDRDHVLISINNVTNEVSIVKSAKGKYTLFKKGNCLTFYTALNLMKYDIRQD